MFKRALQYEYLGFELYLFFELAFLQTQSQMQSLGLVGFSSLQKDCENIYFWAIKFIYKLIVGINWQIDTADEKIVHYLYLQSWRLEQYINISMQQNRNKTFSDNYFHGMDYSNDKPNYINQMYHDVSQTDSFIDDQLDSQVEPAFETKNMFFELQSKCNNLEYEKTKIVMAHQNMLSELKHKNAYLEQIAGNLSLQNQQLTEERDILREVLGEVRQQNHSLSKEINGLKIELQNMHQGEMSNQSFQEDDEYHSEIERQLADKNQEIQQKNKQINRLKIELNKSHLRGTSALKSEAVNIFKQTIAQLQRQKVDLSQRLQFANQMLNSTKSDKEEAQTIIKQKQELLKQVRQKQISLNQLRQEKKDLTLEMETLKDDIMMKDRRSSLTSNQSLHRLKETLQTKQMKMKVVQNDKMQFENKSNELMVEINRLKCQKNSLEQYNKYLQDSNTQNQNKRKSMQQDLYKYQKEVSDLKAQIFTIKLQNKKDISTLKLEFEGQKIKNIQCIEQKEKQIAKLRGLASSGKNSNVEIKQVKIKSEQFEKALQDINRLKKQNQSLKADLKNLELKYEKKTEKYTLLEKEVRAEYEKRVKSLQNEIYKFQIQGSEFPSRLGFDGTKSNQFSGLMLEGTIEVADDEDDNDNDQNLKQLVELLKIDKKEQSQKIKQLKDKAQGQNQTIIKLQSQLKELKSNKSVELMNQREIQQKMKIINQLNNTIEKLNDDVKRQRFNSQLLKADISAKEDRYIKEKEQFQEEKAVHKQQNQELQSKIVTLQQQTQKKDSFIATKQEQINNLANQIKQCKQENQQTRLNQNYFQSKISDLQKLVESLKKGKQAEKSKVSLKKSLSIQEGVTQKMNALPHEWTKIGSLFQREPQTSQLLSKISKLQHQNHTLQYEYSQSLEEVNAILIKYQNLQQKYKKLQVQYHRLRQQPVNDSDGSKLKFQELLKQHQQYRQTINNCQSQITKLNQILMQKQMEIKRLEQNSHTCSHSKMLSNAYFDKHEPNKYSSVNYAVDIRKRGEFTEIKTNRNQYFNKI